MLMLRRLGGFAESWSILLFQSSMCHDSELIVPSSWHLPIASYLRISWDFTYSKAISQPSGACCTMQRSFSLGSTCTSSGGESANWRWAGTVGTAAAVPASACSPQPFSMEAKIFHSGARLRSMALHRCWSRFVFNSWVLHSPTAAVGITMRRAGREKSSGDPDLLCGL